MIFSKLTEPFEQPLNRLYAERRRLQAAKVPLIDLVSGNVSEEGIQFPAALVSRALADGLHRSRHYQPDPLGRLAARQAISRFYKTEGLGVPPEQIVLTPGTSLAYAYLFQILGDPGDDILCPQPSYPLFSMIADAARLQLTSYHLRPGQRWSIDFASIEAAVTPRTRAIIIVSPHNPTGAVASELELHQLGEWASRRGLAVISDEVFSPFLVDLKILPRAANTKAPLVLTLNGFSKMLALPGMKLGWIAVTGDAVLVRKTVASLEMISDTYLPVNEAVQAAVPKILSTGKSFLKNYRAEILKRTHATMTRLESIPGVRFIQPEGGFYVTCAIDGKDEEDVCWRLLTNYHTVVHPGFFYDIDGSHLIISTVHRPVSTERGLNALEKVLR